MDLFTLSGLALVGAAATLGAAATYLVDRIARASERRDRNAEADTDQSGQE